MKYSFLTLTAVCLLLPSCVRWNIGACIRELGEERMGVDVAHPVGGRRYERKEKETGTTMFYVRAPEVRYRQSTPLVEWVDSLGMGVERSPRRVRDVQPTGRELLACCDVEYVRRPAGVPGFGHPFSHEKLMFRKEVDSLPPEATPAPYLRSDCFNKLMLDSAAREAEPEVTADVLGTLSVHRHWAATLAAAPFDYAIDPALSGVSTVAGWGASLVVGLGYFTLLPLAEVCWSWAQPQELTPPAPEAEGVLLAE